MLMSLAAGLLAFTIVAGADGPADVAAAPSQAAPADVVAKKDKVKCRSVRTTGSRMPQRVCGTQESWDRRQDAAKRHTEKLQEGDIWRQGAGPPPA